MQEIKKIKKELLKAFSKDIKNIEKALEDNLNPNVDFVKKIAKHIIFSGGKRLRPILMILSSRVCGYDDEKLFKFSVIFEFLHNATLLHDDLIDEAEIRRGKKVANKVYGNEYSVLTGDFLLSQAVRLGVQTNILKVVKILSEVMSNIVQGEIIQLQNKKNIFLSFEEYEKIIDYKTAQLISSCCQIGAIIADAPKEKEEALKDYGRNIGMIFQLTDDMLDYTADSLVLGKKIGADLREGKLTLPLIYTYKKADKKEQDFIGKLIENPSFTENQFQNLIGILNKYKAIDYTKNLSIEYLKKAKEKLNIFENSKAKELLEMLVDYIFLRNK